MAWLEKWAKSPAAISLFQFPTDNLLAMHGGGNGHTVQAMGVFFTYKMILGNIQV